MGYQIAQATSLDDLMRTKLRSFALDAAHGFADDEGTSVAGRQYLSRSAQSLYWASRWDTGTPANTALFQALGYISGATVPGNHTDDSGNGTVTSFTNATAANSRCVVLTNTTMNYWFFGGEASSSEYYIHCVVEPTPGSGTFVHFGFGVLNKVGTWTGGAYTYGHRMAAATDPINSTNSNLLDGYARGAGVATFCGTLHAESLPSQTGKWGLVWGGGSSNIGTSRSAVTRSIVQGGFRSGPVAFPFGLFRNLPTQGLIPMYPIWTFYRTSNDVYPLGYMKDVRGININSYSGGDEVTVGSDTWVVFPTGLKGSSGTDNQGIAYRKSGAAI